MEYGIIAANHIELIKKSHNNIDISWQSLVVKIGAIASYHLY